MDWRFPITITTTSTRTTTFLLLFPFLLLLVLFCQQLPSPTSAVAAAEVLIPPPPRQYQLSSNHSHSETASTSQLFSSSSSSSSNVNTLSSKSRWPPPPPLSAFPRSSFIEQSRTRSGSSRRGRRKKRSSWAKRREERPEEKDSDSELYYSDFSGGEGDHDDADAVAVVAKLSKSQAKKKKKGQTTADDDRRNSGSQAFLPPNHNKRQRRHKSRRYLNHRGGKNAQEPEKVDLEVGDKVEEGPEDEEYEDEDEDEDEEEEEEDLAAAALEEDNGEEGSARRPPPPSSSTTQHYHHHPNQPLPPTPPSSTSSSSLPTESPLSFLPPSSFYPVAYPSLPPPSYSFASLPHSSTQSPPPLPQSFGNDDMEFIFRQEPSSSSTVSPCSSEDEFLCHSTGTCLPLSRRCDPAVCQDNFADCSDSPDATLFNAGGEQSQCPSNMFRCRDGQCVPSEVHCDFTSQIICGVNEFDCQLDGRCIHESLRCDGYYDCDSYLDEINCENRTCRLSQYRCGTGLCIDRAKRCNGVKFECNDNSDELECWICRTGEYNCASGQCIEMSQRCDGVQNCVDKSDEVDCPNSDIVLQVYPERTSVRQGHEVVFRCRDEGAMHLDVRWSREGGAPLPVGSLDLKGRLTLLNVQTNYSGVYVCSVAEEHQQTFRAVKAAFLTVLPTFDYEIMINHSPQNDPEASDSPSLHSDKECTTDHFQCDNGYCIEQSAMCNGANNCGDNSDEFFCEPEGDGNSTCKGDEFACESGNQCIPKTFHCDGLNFDCVDKSDEIGCTAPTIVESPSAIVVVTEGETVTIKCRSIGIPLPFINWHKNGKQLPPPPRVTSTSAEGHGTLVIRDATFSDQGAYACEASNSLDSAFAPQETLLVIKSHKLLCQSPNFNDLAQNAAECLRCFCFGVSEHCHSSSVESKAITLFGEEGGDRNSHHHNQQHNQQHHPPNHHPPNPHHPHHHHHQLTVVPVEQKPNGSYVDVSAEFPPNQKAIRYDPFTKGYQVTSEVAAMSTPDGVHFYWRLPAPAFTGNHLFSYGGHLRYTIRFQRPFAPTPLAIPDVILRGNGITLYHYERDVSSVDESKVAVRFWVGQWHRDPSLHSGGLEDSGAEVQPLFDDTTREDLMIVLQSISEILIKASYDAHLLDSTILDVELDSAVVSNFSDPTRASFIEQCKCPEGYTGSSCEQCSPRFIRQPSGQYLGRCNAAPVHCQCNGHSDECDQFSGQCLNCGHHTEGANCERCQRGYYVNPEMADGGTCTQCPCGQNLAEQVQVLEDQWDESFPEKWLLIPCRYDTLNSGVVCESCPIGYEGRLCRECARGYTRKLSPSGDFVCELKEKCNDDEFRCGNGTCVDKSVRCNGHHDCLPEGNDEFGCDSNTSLSSCNILGSTSTTPNPESGLCNCKRLVSGARCDQCAPGAFYLNEFTLNGCIECFCFGLTADCTAAFSLYRDYVELKLEQYRHGILLRELHHSPPAKNSDHELTFDHLNRELIYRDFTFTSDLYWQLPYQFAGNKITSYGGYLNYTFRFEGNHFAASGGQVPSAVLVAPNLTLHYHYKGALSPYMRNVISVPLLEEYWSTPSGYPVERGQLLSVLARLETILLRATMSSDVSLIALAAVTLDTTVERRLGDTSGVQLGSLMRVETVEECRCPTGYMGTSCERCSLGYKAVHSQTSSTESFGSSSSYYYQQQQHQLLQKAFKCEPCFCNGHSSTCDPETGVCTECQHYTTGNFCERCADGFEGNPIRGTPYDCISAKSPTISYHEKVPPSTSYDSEDPQRKTNGQPPSTHTHNHHHHNHNHHHHNNRKPGSEQCREGFFEQVTSSFAGNHHHHNHCTACYCFGVSSRCSSAASTLLRHPRHLNLSTIYPTAQEHHVELTNRFRTRSFSDRIRVNIYHNELYFHSLFWLQENTQDEFNPTAQQAPETLYWSLPFAGNRLTSYGGYLRYRQRYATTTPSSSSGHYITDVDVFMLGSGLMLQYIHPQPLEANEERQFAIPISAGEPDENDEERGALRQGSSSWQKVDHGTQSTGVATRADFLRVLANLEMIAIRATLHSTMKESILKDVSLDEAVERATLEQYGSYNMETAQVAGEVEQCICPLGHSGLSCESCTEGYVKLVDPKTGALNCVHCSCNGHAEECDSTGRCVGCQHHTAGNHCELCATGFYGDATSGGEPSQACRPCACPATGSNNNFSPTCVLDDNSNGGGYTCTACQPAYTGRHCERCAPGYSPSSRRPGHCELTSVSPAYTAYNTSNSASNSQQTIKVFIEGPPVRHVPAGVTLSLKCSGVSRVSTFAFNLDWIKLEGQLPSGASEASGTLTLPNVQPEDSGTYICTGSDLESVAQAQTSINVESPNGRGGSSTTLVGGVTPTLAISAPKVRIEPRFQEVYLGEAVTFRCIADGQPPPALHWSKGATGEAINPAASFSPETGQFYIPAATKSDEAEYYCQATSSAGSDAVRTVLFVRPSEHYQTDGGAYVHEGAIPTARVSPANYVAVQGESNVRLECNVTGTPVPSVRWTFTGGGPDGRLPPNARELGGVLLLANVELVNGGVYTCIASNSQGTAEAQVRLKVVLNASAPPTVSVEPIKQTIVQGQTGELRCVTTGSPKPSVAWQKIGLDQLDPSRHKVLDGEKLIIERMEVNDRGLYVCRAENSEGVAQASAVVEIEMREVPSIEIHREPNAIVMRGSSTYFQCRVTGGIPEPSLEWRRSDGSPFSPKVEVIEGLLRFKDVAASDEGSYICTAENIAGRVMAEATLHITGAPRIKILQSTPFRVRAGEHVRLECRVISRPPSADKRVSLNWYKLRSSSPLLSGYHSHQGGNATSPFSSSPNSNANSYAPPAHPVNIYQDRAILEFRSIKPADNGVFICSGSSAMGATEERIQVIVEEQTGQTVPDVYIEDKVVTVAAGSRAELRCFVRGTNRPVTLKWARADGRKLSEKSRVENGTLSIDQVTPDDSGDYHCLGYLDTGTGSSGSAGSGSGGSSPPSSRLLFRDRARLAVVGIWARAPPKISIYPPLQTVRPGDTAYIDCVAFDSTGSASSVTVDWSRLGARLPAGVSTEVAGARLVIRGVQPTDAGRYLCTAANAAGKAWGTGELIVDASEEEAVDEGVGGESTTGGDYHQHKHRLDHQEEVVILGSNLDLRCPPPPPRVKSPYYPYHQPAGGEEEGVMVWWKFDQLSEHRDAQQLPPNAQVVDNELRIVGAQLFNAGKYICTTSSMAGAVIDQRAIFLKVKEPRRIVCQWRSQFTCASSSANQYQEQCVPLSARCDGTAQCSDGSDEEGCHAIPTLDIKLSPDREKISLGDSLTLNCSVVGDPKAEISWRQPYQQQSSTAAVFPDNVQIMDAGKVLKIGAVRQENGGVYRCTVKTYAGTFNADYVLVIQDPPIPTTTTPKPDLAVETVLVPLGSPIELSCNSTELAALQVSSSSDELPLRYTWRKSASINLDGRLLATFDEGVSEAASIDLATGRLVIGQSRPSDAGTYVCTAVSLADGRSAEVSTIVVVEGIIPRFHQTPTTSSYMILPKLPPTTKMEFNLSISVRPEKPDGLLLYSEQFANHTGDYISLGLSSGRVVFTLELGGGAVVLTSEQTITTGEWHLIKIFRVKHQARMRIDDGPTEVSGASSRPKFVGLDLHEPLYVGGLPHNLNLKDKLLVARSGGLSTVGFSGCISLFRISNRRFELMKDALEKVAIGRCETCLGSPCSNSGTCREDVHQRTGYECVCPVGFSGTNCQLTGGTCYSGACGHRGGLCVEDKAAKSFRCQCPFGSGGARCELNITIREVSLAEGAYLAFRPPLHTLEKMHIRLKVKPKPVSSSNSSQLLLYSGQHFNGSGDFAALTIANDSTVQFTFDTGSGAAVINSGYPLPEGQWTEIVVDRVKKSAKLIIGSSEVSVAAVVVEGQAPGRTHGLTLLTPLYIGGYNRTKVALPHAISSSSSSPVAGINHFEGCIAQLEINQKAISLLRAHVEAVNVANCDSLSAGGVVSGTASSAGVCSSAPCLNGGSCSQLPNENSANDGGNGYSCRCEGPFSGKNCELKQTTAANPCSQSEDGEEEEGRLLCANKGECEVEPESDVNDGTLRRRCHCPIGFGGSSCEEEVLLLNPHSAFMSGQSFLAFDNSYLTQANQGFEYLRFNLKTKSEKLNSSSEPNRLLVYYGQPPESTNGRDYLAVVITTDGGLVMLYELGSGEGRVVFSPADQLPLLNDDKVHLVEVKLTGREGQLTVDGSFRASGRSTGALTVLNVDADIFIGGVVDYRALPSSVKKVLVNGTVDSQTQSRYNGYSGCIWDITIGRSDVLDLKESSKRSRNIAPCDAQSDETTTTTSTDIGEWFYKAINNNNSSSSSDDDDDNSVDN